MPTIPSLLRRRGPSSDADIRRHSLYGVNTSADDTLAIRDSNQPHRAPLASSFLSPTNASMPAIVEPSNQPENRSVSPPIQDESSKHRRFSMLRFRHASDSQLSTRARQQADAAATAAAAAAAAPPMPKRWFPKVY